MVRAMLGGQQETLNQGALKLEKARVDALQQLGREAARSLFQAMGSTANKPHGIEHLPVRLIIRGSTIPHR
jgi:hypothetical protein